MRLRLRRRRRRSPGVNLLVEWRVPVEPVVLHEGLQLSRVPLIRSLPLPRVLCVGPPRVEGPLEPPRRTIFVGPLAVHLLEVEEAPKEVHLAGAREPLEETIGLMEGLHVHPLLGHVADPLAANDRGGSSQRGARPRSKIEPRFIV